MYMYINLNGKILRAPKDFCFVEIYQNIDGFRNT